MAKRWAIGGIWSILMLAGVLACGRNATAEQPRTSKKILISDMIITGNRRMSTEQIKAHLRTQPGQEYDAGVVAEDVRKLYNLNQFSAIETRPVPDGDGKVKIYFSLRELPNKVQKVTFLGAKHIKETELLTITGVRKGRTLQPNLNRQGCQRILDKYMEMGRTLSDCRLLKGGDAADTEVVYQITEGPKIKVHDIQFVGNTFVSGARLATHLESLKEWYHLRIGPYHKLTAEAGKADIEKYYRKFGYQDVQVSLETKRSADGLEVSLIYHIQEGPRYRIQDVPDVCGTEIVPLKQLKALSEFKPGDYLDERKLQKDIKSITDYLGDRGKAVRVEAIPVWITEQPGLCGVRYEVAECLPARISQIFIMGNTCTKDKADTQAIKASDSSNGVVVQAASLESRIGKIRVTGNKRISTESILAHVPLVPGNVLSYADLREAEENLAVLDLFVVDKATGVRPTITVIDGEGESECKDLLITVKEKAKAKSKKSQRSR